jgi:hypothetical protein
MTQTTINTVIVLRNDQTTNWESSEYKLLPGEVGIGYLKKNVNGKEVTNVIAKLGTDGKTAWKDLPQIEGVFEDELTLTYDFGRYKTDADKGFVKTTNATGMTTSQWLLHALSEVKEPEITNPTVTLVATGTGAGGEVGTYITALGWNGTTTYGSYEYGPDTGLTSADQTWSISNSIDNQTATSEDGTFTLSDKDKIQLTQEASKTYATVTGTYSLDVSKANTPVNNVGDETSGKIAGSTEDPTKIAGTIVAKVNATAYRKPFWGVLDDSSVLDIEKLSSEQIRLLPKSGTSNAGLPTTLSVPVGSRMVIFAAKAGAKNTLVAKDGNSQDAVVSFEKISSALDVNSANDYDAVKYDIWYVKWAEGIKSAKELKLTWS